MAARTGPFPWDHKKFWNWREGYRKVSNTDLKRRGVQHSLESGYRQVTWDKEPRKPSTKKVKLYNGRTVEVPDGDFEDFIGHQRSPTAEDYNEIAKYIDEAWIGKKEEVAGVGHIFNIEYSPSHQLLWVEFDNDGAVVVFFRVPKVVYSELYHLAVSGAMAIGADGTQRHVLGMRFWDIVRIRGQRTGARYRYEYQVEGERTGTEFEREMAAGQAELQAAPQAATMDIAKETIAVYDKLARNKLSESKQKDYFKLDALKDKENFLRRANIL